MNHNARTITLTEDDLRLIGFWAADCAERVLPLFAAKLTRPRPRLNARSSPPGSPAPAPSAAPA